MEKKQFSIKERINSFRYAFQGLKLFFLKEHNVRIHILAAIAVLIAGFCFGISTCEWIAIVFSIGFVITTEAINTAIEQLADFVSQEQNQQIKIIKDLAAGAVFISAMTALIIACIVFIPKIMEVCCKN
jgi:diacylglycerol kinase